MRRRFQPARPLDDRVERDAELDGDANRRENIGQVRPADERRLERHDTIARRHLRACPFDAAIDTALRSGDPGALRDLDAALGVELWAHDVPALQALGSAADAVVEASVTYAGDPYGVQYWVARWTCGS